MAIDKAGKVRLDIDGQAMVPIPVKNPLGNLSYLGASQDDSRGPPIPKRSLTWFRGGAYHRGDVQGRSHDRHDPLVLPHS